MDASMCECMDMLEGGCCGHMGKDTRMDLMFSISCYRCFMSILEMKELSVQSLNEWLNFSLKGSSMAES